MTWTNLMGYSAFLFTYLMSWGFCFRGNNLGEFQWILIYWQLHILLITHLDIEKQIKETVKHLEAAPFLCLCPFRLDCRHPLLSLLLLLVMLSHCKAMGGRWIPLFLLLASYYFPLLQKSSCMGCSHPVGVPSPMAPPMHLLVSPPVSPLVHLPHSSAQPF